MKQKRKHYNNFTERNQNATYKKEKRNQMLFKSELSFIQVLFNIYLVRNL